MLTKPKLNVPKPDKKLPKPKLFVLKEETYPL